MQKLLRRTELAKRQAARKGAVRRGKWESDSRKLRENEQKIINISIRDDRRAALIARHEDWFLGPLAPKRDAGDAQDTYGALDSRRFVGVEKPKVKNWGIVKGDRVVIVQDGHPERGRIGTVSEVRKKAEECVVKGLNKALVAVPEYLLLRESDKTPARPYEAPLPLSAVRLVAPLPHPETGALRDVVIKELILRRTTKRESRGEDPPSRFIAGLKPKTLIPYPETEPEVFQDNDCDTLRIEVEEATWVPTLVKPPMPPSIIDELRNKYSKFRERHDEVFIAKKIQEDKEAEERKRGARAIITPLKELHRKERMEKKARGKPQLSEEMLARIGEVMAKRQIPELPSQMAVSI